MKSFFRCVVVLALVVLAVWACAFQVQENEFAIVARFGDPVRTIEEPGLQFRWPPPIDSVIRVSRSMHVLDPAPNEYLTSDKKNVIVDSFLVWSVDDPLKYWVSIGTRTGADSRLTDILRSVVGDVLSANPFSALVSDESQETTMFDLSEQITQMTASKALEGFGIKVGLARIKRLNYPMQNKEAVFGRMEQERGSIAQGIRSEGDEQYERIKADADREEAQLVSDAARKAKEIMGEADAEATRIYAEAYSKNPELYRFLRSLETLETLLGESSTLVLPSDHELLEVLGSAGAKQPTPTEQGDG
ncbi:MAG: protease modulator HflC [Planctomycetota bacterium]